MRTYRKATAILISLITVTLLVTVVFSLVSLYGRQGISITYGQPTESEEHKPQPVNINTATAEELTAINGIGATKAAAIVEYREANGNFSAVEDLLLVPGIGEKTLEAIRDYIYV